jgi:hypothetical protein
MLGKSLIMTSKPKVMTKRKVKYGETINPKKIRKKTDFNAATIPNQSSLIPIGVFSKNIFYPTSAPK